MLFYKTGHFKECNELQFVNFHVFPLHVRMLINQQTGVKITPKDTT